MGNHDDREAERKELENRARLIKLYSDEGILDELPVKLRSHSLEKGMNLSQLASLNMHYRIMCTFVRVCIAFFRVLDRGFQVYH